MLDDSFETKFERFLRGIAENMESLNREALNDFLSDVIGQVTLDPATHECQIDYRIGIKLGIRWHPQGESSSSRGLLFRIPRTLRRACLFRTGVTPCTLERQQ